MKYCFLDLETTGLEHDKDSILEVSFIVTDENLNEITRLDELVFPKKTPLTPFVTHLTGITPEEVTEKGKNWEDVQEDVIQKIGDATIVGHNIDFDIRFLKENGIPLEKNKRIDTHELARILLPGDESFSLEAITQRLNLSHEDAHRAMSDVVACIQLWPLLIEKIKELPQEAIPEFSTFFTQSTWAAAELFLKYCGTKPSDSFVSLSKKQEFQEPLPEIETKELEEIEQEHTTFVRVGSTGKSARWLTALSQQLPNKTLIVAPELSFFSGITQIPIPSVLFDPERHMGFWKMRDTMDDLETTFWLQCAVRHWLGHRGVTFFNLYLHQRDFWKEVCIESIKHPLFQTIIQERTPQKTLICTPAAWAELADIPLIKERKLLVLETEIFAEKILFSSSKTISLQPFLDQPETSFFIAGFVREVIEKTLQRTLSTFPERVLLRSGQTYSEFATSLRNISETTEAAAQWLENPETGLVRWTSYFPQTGTLTISAWHPKDWRMLQQKFNDQSALLCLRHNGGESNAFCRVFLGRQDGKFLEKKELQASGEVIIPQGLVSSKSPDFAPFCAQKITELVEERDDKNWVAAGFSSLATLKNVGALLQDNPPTECTVIGEKLAGGDTKMIGQLLQQKKAVLLLQKLQSPLLETLPFQTFVIQKFPFAPPQPLLDYFKNEWKNVEQNFWDVWIIPTVTARLSRAIGQFKDIKTIIVLDPSESSPWGKTVLQNAFPSFPQRR
jgi:DNA polymerase III epsilon subunit-like protein